MSTSNVTGCDENTVLALQNSVFLHVSEIVMLILSLISVPILLLTIQKCISDSYFHLNIRMITVVHCLSILLHCIGRIIQHSSDIYLWMAPIPTCDKRQFFELCLVSRTMYTFGIYSSSFTSVFMVIERTIATSLSRKYEHKRAKTGIMLVIFEIWISVVITFFLFLGGSVPDRPGYCFFHSRKDWALVVEIVTITANALAFVQCCRLYNINMNLRTTFNVADLSQKYQIEENKTLIQILLRFICLDFVFMVIYFLFTLLMETLFYENSDATTYAFFELIHCVPVYAIVVLFTMSGVIKKVHREKANKLSADMQVKNDEYFHFLKEQWAHAR